MLKGQSKAVAEVLAKALIKKDDLTFNAYSVKLASIRDKIEELMWVLSEKTVSILPSSVNLLEFYVQNPLRKDEYLTISQILDKLRSGQLSMNNLAPEVCDMIKKTATVQSKNSQQ
jgi:hypothetical protein